MDHQVIKSKNYTASIVEDSFKNDNDDKPIIMHVYKDNKGECVFTSYYESMHLARNDFQNRFTEVNEYGGREILQHISGRL